MAVWMHAPRPLHPISAGAPVRSSGRPAGRDLTIDHPLLTLQRAIGNHLVARLLRDANAIAAIQRNADVVPPAAASCPRRSSGEAARSRSSDGILANDVALNEADHRLLIQDFPVNSAAPPPGITTTPDWQRAMSLIVGDRTSKIAVTGYTDCAGTMPENLELRRKRASAVLAALPPAVRSRLWASGPDFTTNFLDSNETPEGRARNRSVSVTYLLDVTKKDAGEVVAKAQTLDEYLYLVRHMERKLKLTSPADAPTALSVLRQIYYGSASWSASRHRVWDDVITSRPWASGADPTPALGEPLMQALKESQVVEGIDVGHVLTGIDAMMKPGTVDVRTSHIIVGTTLQNEAWATWAGDVGSAASEWALDRYYSATNNRKPPDYFRRLASDSDLLGDIDSFALRAGFGGGASSAQIGQSIQLKGPLSNALLEYYRVSSSKPGQARSKRVQTFVESYGGQIEGGRLKNRAALIAALQPQVHEFMLLVSLPALLKRGQVPPRPEGAPPISEYYDDASAAMTGLFVEWLETRLQTESTP